MIEAAMIGGQLPVLVSLGRHDLDLAKAAVDAGVFGLKFHLNAYHRASGSTFGTFAEERPFIEALAKLGKPMLVMSGQETQPSLDELEALADYGVEGWNIYLKHVQPHMLQSRLKPILALDSESGQSDIDAIRAIPGAMVEASIGRFAEYGQPLNDADLARFAEIVRMSGRPVIAPSQKKFTPADVPGLRQAGIGAILLGAVVTGLDAASLSRAVAPIVEATTR
ncbi:hypothetical protein PRN20_08505 [Devosia sp. ZB163]|uniref:hypothetical protein n=1 Tax=Devosia sp. ZB163 TaxID=3025938 RepID=UPI0023601089|nr:hypothetical protein [Devosia sp. ZB163]MDC9823772.1 hypothetical protein [Devosia sp. ZB163]